jgi:hypothetical protein
MRADKGEVDGSLSWSASSTRQYPIAYRAYDAPTGNLDKSVNTGSKDYR